MISLRLASAPDAPNLARLSRYVHDLHAGARPDVFKPFDVTSVSDHFAEFLASGAQRVLVAEDAGRAVGYAALLVRERTENVFCFGRRWLEVDSLCVHPDHRRRGVARSLIERAAALARDEGLDLELNAWSFNGVARAAFAAVGFREQTSRFEYCAPHPDR